MSSAQVPEGYKQTEIGVIPEDWQICYLKELTDKSEPITYGVLKPGDYIFDGIPLLQIKDVIYGEINTDELHKISKQLDSQYSRTRLSGGEIVISLVGTIGKIAHIPSSLLGANLHRNLAKISISKENISKFIFYQLNSNNIQSAIKLTTFGSTQALLNLADLRALSLLVPPLPEQRAIAQALSDVDALIASLDKLIAKQRQLKTAAMQQLLTGKMRLPGFGGGKGYKQTEVGLIPEDWESKILGEIFQLGNGFSFKSEFFSSNGPIVLTPGNFKLEGGLYFNDRNTKRYSGFFPESTIFQKGDLLVVMTDLTPDCNLLGKPAFVDSEGIILHNQRIGRVNVISKNIDKFFLYLLLLSSSYLNKIKEQATGSTVRHTSNKSIYSIALTIPQEIEEQRAIATVLSDIDTAITALETRRAKTQAIKQGMMQELLTGRTRLI